MTRSSGASVVRNNRITQRLCGYCWNSISPTSHLCQVNNTTIDTTYVLRAVYNGFRYQVYLKRGDITYFVGRHRKRKSDD